MSEAGGEQATDTGKFLAVAVVVVVVGLASSISIYIYSWSAMPTGGGVGLYNNEAGWLDCGLFLGDDGAVRTIGQVGVSMTSGRVEDWIILVLCDGRRSTRRRRILQGQWTAHLDLLWLLLTTTTTHGILYRAGQVGALRQARW